MLVHPLIGLVILQKTSLDPSSDIVILRWRNDGPSSDKVSDFPCEKWSLLLCGETSWEKCWCIL